MWEKIAKEMQIPWRAAENMHWQMGEADMAQRANVPLFQLAGQGPSRGGAMPDRPRSTSPASSSSAYPGAFYSRVQDPNLPPVPLHQFRQISPPPGNPHRSNNGSSPNGHPLRRRADSATGVPTLASFNNNTLPPIGEAINQTTPPSRHTLAPVMTSSEPRGR